MTFICSIWVIKFSNWCRTLWIPRVYVCVYIYIYIYVCVCVCVCVCVQQYPGCLVCLTWHAGNCWRSKEKFVSDILLWISIHRLTSVGWQTRIYILQLGVDTKYSLEDLSGGMDNRDSWWEREPGNSVLSAWFHEDDICIYVYAYIYIYIYSLCNLL